MNLRAYGKSDIGNVREINQDAFGIFQKEDFGLFVVADGMGGHSNGDKASRVAVTELSNWWNSFSPVLFEYDFRRMMASIEQVIEYTNEIIYDQYGQYEVCGTTIVVLFVYKHNYGILYAGDSRCYLAQGMKWELLTQDDVWENQSSVSKQERLMLDHPNRGKLVKAIGANNNVHCKMITDIIKKNTVFLLCSDGLYKFCKDSDLRSYARKYLYRKEIEKDTVSIFKIVYENGAKDNATVIIVKCSEN